MRKIFLLLAMSFFILPVHAVCSITGGACTDFTTPSLQDKLAPNKLNELNRPNAFQREMIKPYDSNLINMDRAPEVNDYNSNCQFGICLPGGSQDK